MKNIHGLHGIRTQTLSYESFYKWESLVRYRFLLILKKLLFWVNKQKTYTDRKA
jgi:hypothetical protein